MTSQMGSVGGWVKSLMVVLFVIDLVALVRPKVALFWLRQWLAWSNRLSRCCGVERQIIDERRCQTAIRVCAVIYLGVLIALASLLCRAR